MSLQLRGPQMKSLNLYTLLVAIAFCLGERSPALADQTIPVNQFDELKQAGSDERGIRLDDLFSMLTSKQANTKSGISSPIGHNTFKKQAHIKMQPIAAKTGKTPP